MDCLTNSSVDYIGEDNPILVSFLYNGLNILFFPRKMYKALTRVFIVLNVKFFDRVHLNNNFSLWFRSKIPCAIAILMSTWKSKSFFANISLLATNLAMFFLFAYFKFCKFKIKFNYSCLIVYFVHFKSCNESCFKYILVFFRNSKELIVPSLGIILKITVKKYTVHFWEIILFLFRIGQLIYLVFLSINPVELFEKFGWDFNVILEAFK